MFDPRQGGIAAAVLLAGLGGACRQGADGPPAPVRVAAASDLGPAFEELGALFLARTGRAVAFTFGSSGLLAKQVALGAPFDVFAAANVTLVDEVVRAGACRGDTAGVYARGSIVVWTGEGVDPPATLADLAAPRFARIAIANPEHAPYGRAAEQALAAAKVAEALRGRLVLAENVRQALQHARSGNAEAAIVALSLVVGDGPGRTLAIDERLYAPIDQALVVCTQGSQPTAGAAFADLVRSSEGRAILRRHGFGIPGEALAERGPAPPADPR